VSLSAHNCYQYPKINPKSKRINNMSTTASPAATLSRTSTARPAVQIPSTFSAFSSLLRADLITQWRNRRASMLVILMPVIILMAWKGLVGQFGGTFVMANCITVGLNAIGLMGYTNSIARDRDKGIFQRLRVTAAANWIIMASRLTVQLIMIVVLTLVMFIVGHQFDHITFSASGYALCFIVTIVAGAVYLSLGQVIVGLINNPETVNATSRLIYIGFIMIGMFSEFGMLGNQVRDIVRWSPYGTVKRIVSDSLTTSGWNSHSNMALLAMIGYTLIFSILGIRWFRWSTR
jgi:ABC-2 type transport system permease protein